MPPFLSRYLIRGGADIYRNRGSGTNNTTFIQNNFFGSGFYPQGSSCSCFVAPRPRLTCYMQNTYQKLLGLEFFKRTINPDTQTNPADLYADPQRYLTESYNATQAELDEVNNRYLA